MSSHGSIQQDDPSIIQCTSTETVQKKKTPTKQLPMKNIYVSDQKIASKGNCNLRVDSSSPSSRKVLISSTVKSSGSQGLRGASANAEKPVTSKFVRPSRSSPISIRSAMDSSAEPSWSILQELFSKEPSPVNGLKKNIFKESDVSLPKAKSAPKEVRSLESVYRGTRNSTVRPKPNSNEDHNASVPSVKAAEEESSSKKKRRNKRNNKKNKADDRFKAGNFDPSKREIRPNPSSNAAGKAILGMVSGKNKETTGASAPVDPALKPPHKSKEKDDNPKQGKPDVVPSDKTTNADGRKETEAQQSPHLSRPKMEEEDDTGESDTVKLEKLGLQQAETRLSRDFIFPLKQKSAQFPSSKFFCRLCNYHLDSVIHAHRHIKDKRHRKIVKEKRQNELLCNIETPPRAAVESLQQVLLNDVLVKALDQSDLEMRKTVVQKLNRIISKELKGSSVVIYGSSLSGLGFKSSNINVDLQFPSSMRAPNALLRVLDIIGRAEGVYKDVNADFRGKIPRIEFIDASTSIVIRLSTCNDSAISTSRLLLFYSALDVRVSQLSMVFRTWAQMCRLDRQHEGSMPPYAFVLMTIFFMQRLKYLPVLHEIIHEHDMTEILNKSMHCNQLIRKGKVLWYLPTHAPSTSGSSKETQKGAEDSDSESELDVSTQSATDAGDVTDSPGEKSPSKSESENRPSAEKQRPLPLKPTSLLADCTGQDLTLADLWLEMLKFFGLQYPIEDQVISICHSKPVTREDRNWGKKRIAILDPYLTKRNLCRCMNTQAVFTYMMSRLKSTITYFYSVSPKKVKPASSTSTETDGRENATDESQQVVDDLVRELVDELVGMVVNDGALVDRLSMTAMEDALRELDAEETKRYDYKFTESILTEGKYPTIVCMLCKSEGHSQAQCPDEIGKHKLVDLPPLSDELRDMLDYLCTAVLARFSPSMEELNDRQKICSNLTHYLQMTYHPQTHLQLFGSSRNGFGFARSDLDICLTFDDNEYGEGLDFISVIENVAKCLRKFNDVRSILPITTAKVPIVKFEHRATGLEADISLYNLLAQRNTRMLSCYAKIDQRCRILGYVMKAFVKLCHVGDASRGSLSSYAYTLMVIYFLQQRKPAVLPVLQQLGTNDNNKKNKVDGWDSWFYEDIGNLNKVWPDMGKNKESVGELWLGMLRFYTEEFDFVQHVVCIRQKELLTTFEKEWTSKFVSIEDPFDLNHNLGTGVSRKMTNFILRVFVKARQHFGTPPSPKITAGRDEMNYFLDAKILMDGEEAPNDRCCKICGKIGHFLRDCPRKRGRRKQHEDGEKSAFNDVQCFYCKEMGHMKKDCPALKSVNEQLTPKRRQRVEVESPSAAFRHAARSSPLHRGPQGNRIDSGRSPLSKKQVSQMESPDCSQGRAQKRLFLGSPTSNHNYTMTPCREPPKSSRPRRQSSSSSLPSPGVAFDSGNDVGEAFNTPPRNVYARLPPSGAHFPGHTTSHLPGTLTASCPLPVPTSVDAQRRSHSTVTRTSPNMRTVAQIESQFFHNSNVGHEASAASAQEQPYRSGAESTVIGFASQSSPVIVPAAPMLGLGLQISGHGQMPPNVSPSVFQAPPRPHPAPFPCQNPNAPQQASPMSFLSYHSPNSRWNSFAHQ